MQLNGMTERYLVASDGLGVPPFLLSQGAPPVLPVLHALLHDVHDVVAGVDDLGRAVLCEEDPGGRAENQSMRAILPNPGAGGGNHYVTLDQHAPQEAGRLEQGQHEGRPGEEGAHDALLPD